MDNLIIENKGDQMILTLNKKAFDKNYLISLIKRLRLESFAQKANFDSSILNIAGQINQDWWDANGEKFLNDIKE